RRPVSGSSRRALFFEPGEPGEVLRPGQGGAEPALRLRAQLPPLLDGAHAQPVDLPVGHGRGEERGAALGAEPLCAGIAAVGRLLHVDLRLARDELEGALLALHVGAIAGARAGLAVRAMADRDLVRVDLRLV